MAAAATRERDVELLREVQRLSQDEGVNLAGIKRIIELTNQVEALQSRLSEMAEELEQLRANQQSRPGRRAQEHGTRGVATRSRSAATSSRLGKTR